MQWSSQLTSLRRAVFERLRDPYVGFCAGAIAVWLLVWLLAFHNLYGWLLDDEDTFVRYQIYTSGGRNFFDIPWFHSYMWFLAFLPWQLHWSVASHVAPRAWESIGQFRALILYTICLHAVVLGMLAYFLRQLCEKRMVAAAAFLLVLTSPTLTLFTPLLDSRYLGFLAALPAMILLIRAEQRGDGSLSRRLLITNFFLPGFLFGVGEDIHYECLYLVVPFVTVYWSLVFIQGWRSRATWSRFLYFASGLAAWIVPVQLLSMLFHPFDSSYIGTLLTHYARQIPPYTRLENMSTWIRVFISEMGVPMMLAVAAGALVLSLDRLRPSYIRRFDARVMVWCMLMFTAYLILSPTFPFYRMAFGLQFFYAMAAIVFIDAVTQRFVRRSPSAQWAVGIALLLVIAYVPSMLRTREVFEAQQGLGKAVNLAYTRGGAHHVYFIDVFDADTLPKAILSREQFEHLSPADYLVTYFPVTFHFKYPDIFALLNDTSPIASYPTLWCTKEMEAQVPTFFGTRHWSSEPPNCEARVFRIVDVRRAASGPRLEVASVSADSTALPSLDPRRVFALREPSMKWYGTELWLAYWDLWVSRPTPGNHWLEVRFARPETIRKITIVPPDFRVPPDFLWYGRKRVENLNIYGSQGLGPMHELWSGSDLQERVIFTATFQPTRVSRLRFIMRQSPGPNPAVGLKYIRFPGYQQATRWPNHDTPGHPPPGR